MNQKINYDEYTYPGPIWTILAFGLAIGLGILAVDGGDAFIGIGWLCIGEHGLVFAPELEFVGAEDGGVLLESLGDQSGVVIDVADTVLLVVSHCSNLLLIIFSGVLCSPVF